MSTTDPPRAPTSLPVPDEFEPRRVAAFLAVAFGGALAIGAAVYATGGLDGSPTLLPGFTLATVLISVGLMFSPALGNVVARAATGEGFDDLAVRPRLRESLRWYLLAWLGTPLLVLLGAAAYFLVFPGQFDPALSGLQEQLDAVAGETGRSAAVSAPVLLAIQLGLAVVLGPTINALFAFGEEFGWRAYLLPKLLPLGERPAILVHGVVWGAWHWPIVAMGYNYGVGYPGAPWTGMLAMAWATTAMGAFLAWLTLRSGSVLPAAVGHGMVNAVGAVGLAFVAGSPARVLGPIPVGVVGSFGFVAVAAWLLASPSRLYGRATGTSAAEADGATADESTGGD